MIWFERFELRSFGPFTDAVLDLRGGATGHLHVVSGPNEAGKSTTKRAVGDFLFGVPLRTRDTQVHARPDLRLAAAVRTSDGLLALVRRTTSRESLLNEHGAVVDEAVLAGLLGGMRRDVFESMFSITNEALQTGGKALLDSAGELGESLFSASLGAGQLHELQSELAEQADRIFRPRSRTKGFLLEARSDYDRAHAALRAHTLRTRTFTEHERQLRVAEAERTRLEAELVGERTANGRRDRLALIVGPLAELEQVGAELHELEDTPPMPADARDRRLRAVERLDAGERLLARHDGQLADLATERDVIATQEELLAHAQPIKSLYSRSEAASEGEVDLGRQQAKLETTAAQAAAILAQIDAGRSLEQADGLRLTDARRSELDAAACEHARLAGELDAAVQAAELAEQRLKDAEPPAERTAEVVADDADLVAVVQAVRELGDIELRLLGERQEAAAARRARDAAVAGLDPAIDLDGLGAPVPGEARITRFEQEMAGADEERRDLERRSGELQTDRKSVSDGSDQLLAAGAVPTPGDLDGARESRSGAWRPLRQALLRGSPVPDAAVAVSDFEEGLAAADALADRLRFDADRVAAAAAFAARAVRIDADEADLAVRHAGLAARTSALEQDWAELWAPTGITPHSPAEMRAWLASRAIALERAAEDERLACRVQATEGQIAVHAAALRAALLTLGEHPDEALTLAALIARAEDVLRQSASERERREMAERELAQARTAAAQQQRIVERATERLGAAGIAWEQLIAKAGWAAEVLPGAVGAMLARVQKLSGELDAMNSVQGRIDGIERRLAAFRKDVANVVAACAPDLEAQDPRVAVAELERRLSAATRDADRREALCAQIAGVQKARDTAATDVEEAKRELATLRALAGVQHTEELADAELCAQRVEQLRGRRDLLEVQIARDGRETLAELRAACADTDVAALDAEVAAAHERISALEGELRVTNERVGELRTQRAAMDDTAGAADAAQDAADAASEVRALAERHVRLRVTAWALERAIDRYRNDHKTPVLARANEIFPRLTRSELPGTGTFEGLEVSWNERGEPIIVGRCADGTEKTVEDMSTGTREQLYLSLRLASIERHVASHGPIPVLLDDVVLHSDPVRKVEIFRALGELARVTQVIVFTHEPAVVAAAQHAVDPDVLTLHRLDHRADPAAVVLSAGQAPQPADTSSASTRALSVS